MIPCWRQPHGSDQLPACACRPWPSDGGEGPLQPYVASSRRDQSSSQAASLVWVWRACGIRVSRPSKFRPADPIDDYDRTSRPLRPSSLWSRAAWAVVIRTCNAMCFGLLNDHQIYTTSDIGTSGFQGWTVISSLEPCCRPQRPKPHTYIQLARTLIKARINDPNAWLHV